MFITDLWHVLCDVCSNYYYIHLCCRIVRDDLLHAIRHVDYFVVHSLPGCCYPWYRFRQGIFRKLVDHLVRMDGGQRSEELDGEMLYKAGCTFDCTPLPHHISSPSQICQLMDATKRVLLSLPAPTLISIAR